MARERYLKRPWISTASFLLALLGAWIALAWVDGFEAVPLSAGAVFYPPLGAIVNRPQHGEAWALLLGDSVFFICPERKRGGLGQCPDRVLDRWRACAGQDGGLAGLTLASITSGGQTPFQFEAEAHRCARLPSPPARVFLEVNPRPLYARYEAAQMERRFDAAADQAATIGWDDDPFEPLDPAPPGLWGRGKAWCLGLWGWSRDTVDLWLPPRAARGSLSALKEGRDPFHYASAFGPGRLFQTQALEALVRAGRRFRQSGSQVVYFAVPQNWAALRAELAPADLARFQKNLASSLDRLRQEGFKVLDLSALVETGFEPPPTPHEHLLPGARQRLAEALCHGLP